MEVLTKLVTSLLFQLDVNITTVAVDDDNSTNTSAGKATVVL